MATPDKIWKIIVNQVSLEDTLFMNSEALLEGIDFHTINNNNKLC